MKDIHTAYYAVIIVEFVTFAILIVSFIHIFKSFKNANNQMQVEIDGQILPPELENSQHQEVVDQQAQVENQEIIIEDEIEKIEPNEKSGSVEEGEVSIDERGNQGIKNVSENEQMKLHNLFVNKHNYRPLNEEAFNRALLNGDIVMMKTNSQYYYYKKGYELLSSFQVDAVADIDKYGCCLFAKRPFDGYEEFFYRPRL